MKRYYVSVVSDTDFGGLVIMVDAPSIVEVCKIIGADIESEKIPGAANAYIDVEVPSSNVTMHLALMISHREPELVASQQGFEQIVRDWVKEIDRQ